jgi:hypothetical protein
MTERGVNAMTARFVGLGSRLDLAAQFQSLCVENKRGTLALLDRQ